MLKVWRLQTVLQAIERMGFNMSGSILLSTFGSFRDSAASESKLVALG